MDFISQLSESSLGQVSSLTDETRSILSKPVASAPSTCFSSWCDSPSSSSNRSWPDSCDDICNEEILSKAKRRLEEFCIHNEIPESHGFGHAVRVLAHAQSALQASSSRLEELRSLSVCLAALLHDADDGKYFARGREDGYRNAVYIAELAGAPVQVVDDMVYMISLVSASSNGNSIPLRAMLEPELLWPRWADRLEAIGKIGVVRCFQYNKEVGRPLFDLATPRPTCEEEVWAAATPEKLVAYSAKTLKSATMLDHYYIVLLSAARPPKTALCNPYFETEFVKGAAPLVEMCLEFGATGKIDEDGLRTMAAELDIVTW